MKKPYSIRIFLPDGDPEGLRTIEKSNWSGVGIVMPRALLADCKSRKELSRTGVYVLVGPAEDGGLPRVYVGEGDPIRPRLEQHAIKKDFWMSCIAFSSKDENLNKAHVQYIEAKLVELASAAKRCVLENGNEPALPSLSQADAADAEGFIDEMLLCFPILGLSVFSKPSGTAKDVNILYASAKGVKASGAETAEGFKVYAGSGACGIEVDSCPNTIRKLRTQLIANKVLEPRGKDYVFTQDYVFSSPSLASGIVKARSSNGRHAWKNAEGRPLKLLQEAAE
jgi:hypothetical protein